MKRNIDSQKQQKKEKSNEGKVTSNMMQRKRDKNTNYIKQ